MNRGHSCPRGLFFPSLLPQISPFLQLLYKFNEIREAYSLFTINVWEKFIAGFSLPPGSHIYLALILFI